MMSYWLRQYVSKTTLSKSTRRTAIRDLLDVFAQLRREMGIRTLVDYSELQVDEYVYVLKCVPQQC